MNKKIILTIFVLAIMFATTMIVGAESGITSLPNIKVSFVSQTPDPVEPGKIVELRWMVENIGSGSAEDVQLEIIPEYPFTIYSGDLIQDLGSINGRQTGAKGVIALYKIKIDDNAVEGTSEINIRYRVGTSAWIKLDPYDISIQTTDATLSVTSVKIDPETVAPGKQGTITIEMKNLADSPLKDITTKLDMSSATLPFAPVDSVTEKRIKMVSPGETVKQEYKITTLATAESMIYKIPLTITFYDHLGNAYEKSDIIGVKVGDIPELSTYVETSTIYQAGTSGTVSIKFVNRGVTNIKFLNVKLNQNENYKILSAEEQYLGNVNSDDYETAEYKLYIQPGAQKELELPIDITYKDANNNEYSKQIKPVLKLYNQEEAEKIGVTKKDGSTGIIITIIIVVVGVFVYFKFRKKKHH